jgi:hypothetical protein
MGDEEEDVSCYWIGLRKKRIMETESRSTISLTVEN